MDRRFDDYVFQADYGQEQDLYNEIVEMEKNSIWVPGITSKDIVILGLDDSPLFGDIGSDEVPMMTFAECMRYGIAEDLLDETMNRGQKLVVKLSHTQGLMRNTAYPSLCADDGRQVSGLRPGNGRQRARQAAGLQYRPAGTGRRVEQLSLHLRYGYGSAEI